MVVMSMRVILGLLLMLGGMFVAGALDVLEWSWPLDILALCALTFPGIALFEPALERAVARRLGRPTT